MIKSMMSVYRTCVVVLGIFALVAPVLAEEMSDTSDVTPQESLQTAEEATDNLLPESDGELKKEGGGLVFRDGTPKDGDQIKLPLSGTGKIEMTSKESGSIKIDMPDDGSTGKAQILNESTVVYPNTGLGVDTVVTVPSDNTVETYHLIRSPESPKRYTYKASTEGRELYQVDDKTVMILGADGLPEMTISAPKATDAEGKEVPLKLTIEDNQVVLYVEHDESFVYPVVADPSITKSLEVLGLKISDEEYDYCKKSANKVECLMVVADSVEATGFGRAIGLSLGWEKIDGGADAVRHCYWNGLMTYHIGQRRAKFFADLHEEGNKKEKPDKSLKKKDKKKYENQLGDYNDWVKSTAMDQHNNALGREWASKHPSNFWVDEFLGVDRAGVKIRSFMQSQCVNGVKRGTLVYLTARP